MNDIPQTLNLPPQSIEAEQAVLGGLMLDNDKLDDVFDLLESRHFYTHGHQKIYQAMMDLSQLGQPVDLVTVQKHLQQKNQIESVGGLSYLDNIIRNTPSTANLVTYAEIVFDKAVEREIVLISHKAIESVNGGGTTQEKVDHFESQVSTLSERKNITGPVRIDSLVASAINEIEYRSEHNGVIGLTTGLDDLDSMLCGIEKGDVVVIAGTPGTGKTSLAMNLVQHVTEDQNKTALVFSLEMTQQQLVMRSLSTFSDVPFNLIRSGNIQDHHHAAITQASAELKTRQIYVEDTGGLSIFNIRSRARKIHRNTPLSLIVIDYLQIMAGEGDNTNTRLEKITPAIKSLAKELNIPIILLSQFNREGARKKPQISDLRGSGSIEQDADTIIMLWTQSDDLRPTVEAIIGKQRSGETGSCWLYFDRPILKMKQGAKPNFEVVKRAAGFDA